MNDPTFEEMLTAMTVARAVNREMPNAPWEERVQECGRRGVSYFLAAIAFNGLEADWLKPVEE